MSILGKKILGRVNNRQYKGLEVGMSLLVQGTGCKPGLELGNMWDLDKMKLECEARARFIGFKGHGKKCIFYYKFSGKPLGSDILWFPFLE